jgi:hypothetical protein
VPKPTPEFFPTFIQAGHYTVDQLADFLLAACKLTAEGPPLEIEAKKALTRAAGRLRIPKDRYDETLYLSAYMFQQKMYQQKKNCTDFAAIKRVGGKRSRTLWNNFNARGVSLKQFVETSPMFELVKLGLVKNTPEKS